MVVWRSIVSIQWVNVRTDWRRTEDARNPRWGHSPITCFERRRNSPTWGLTPRMPVCNVTACSVHTAGQ